MIHKETPAKVIFVSGFGQQETGSEHHQLKDRTDLRIKKNIYIGN